jgi:hypothetical protein
MTNTFLKFLAICFFFGILFSPLIVKAQQTYSFETLPSNPMGSSFRGLQVVSDQIVWVSGSKGTVGLSTDGGMHWRWLQVAGYEKRDFRDIVAFDSNSALIMAVAEPAVILRTDNAGVSWQPVFTDSTPGMFLDAMHFVDAQNGIVVGDPIKNQAFLASTRDGGQHWLRYPFWDQQPTLRLDSGEAFFASSGSNIQLLKTTPKFQFYVVTGGLRSRLIGVGSNFNQDIPFSTLGSSRGANSLAMLNNHIGVIVGGDFARDKDSLHTCILVNTQSANPFRIPQTTTHGYRSCVAWISKKSLIACGTSGVDISTDKGNNWKNISTSGYHTLGKAPNGNYVFLAGSSGRIARLAFH